MNSSNRKKASRPAAAARPRLELELTAHAGREFVPYLRKHLPAAHALLKKPLRELSIALVGDARMAALHESFLDIAGPTDVLTFELDHDARGRVTAGEVVVCVPEAKRQAKRRGLEPRVELLLYALHGMLHLCGFDDRTDRDYDTMHRTEDMLLKTLGIGQAFHTPLKARRDSSQSRSDGAAKASNRSAGGAR